MATSLLDRLSGSDNKRHELFVWSISKFELLSAFHNVSKSDTEKIQFYHQSAKDTLDELNLLLRYLTSTEDANDYESHFVFIRIGQIYSLSLFILEDESPGKIFDESEFLIKILSEEDIAIYASNTDDKKKKSPSSNKTHYVYTPAKDLATTILIQIVETFGKELSSLAPLLNTLIFKYFKKMMEKSKYQHATFMTSLLRLYNALFRNCKDFVLDSTYTSKFIKLSKVVFNDIYNDLQDYPVDFISTIIELWKIHFTHDAFIKQHSNNITNGLFVKFIEAEIGIYGFSNDSSRIYTARVLSEILFDYYANKKIITLDEVWEFYTRAYVNAVSRDTTSGCFESIINFIGLCLIVDKNFLSESNYIRIFTAICEIFKSENLIDIQMDSISRSIRYLRYMHMILLPKLGESSKIMTLFNLLNPSTSNIDPDDSIASVFNNDTSDDMSINATVDTQWLTVAQLDLSRILISSLSSSFGLEERIIRQIKDRIVNLSTNEIFNIRVHSNELLKEFLTQFPQYLSETISDSLAFLTSEFKKKDKFSFAKAHGHALIIANVMEIADKDFVSFELIMRITIFTTSFIKTHTTTTSDDIYYKGISCWVLLVGLMSYSDEQYIMMQTHQLFLFWKVLLSPSFIYKNEDELYRNLEIRNHALACMLTYLNNIKIDEETGKQVSYLLTKCSNFNHSISLKSKKIDNVLLMNENRILQVYVKIHQYVKGNFNSSLLILIMKNFSNPNIYTEQTASYIASFYDDRKYRTVEEGKEEILQENTVNNLLRLNDGFSFGLSSKLTGLGISNNSLQQKKHTISNISGGWPSKDYCWYYQFEDEVLRPISQVLSYDHLSMIYDTQFDSADPVYSPKVTTSVIDSSMDIFSFVFPYLNSSIQTSVIENLNLSIYSKSATPMRRIAIAANVCVAIHNTLQIFQKQELALDEQAGKLILESIKKIEFYNDSYITKLKADSNGLIIAAVVRGLPEEEKANFVRSQTHMLINSVAETTEPYFRVFHTLSLATIFKYNSKYTQFEPIFDVIMTLIRDPHPVVHSWALKSLHVLLEKHLMIDIRTSVEIIKTLEELLTDPSYGLYGCSTLRYNYNMEFNSHIVISEIMKALTETVGPSLPELSESGALLSFKNIIISSTISSDIIFQIISSQVYENIATFKLDNILADHIFITLSKSIILNAVNIGIGSSYSNCKYTKCSELVASTSSLRAATEQFHILGQLFKLQKKQLFITDMEHLSWMYLSIYPKSKYVQEYFFEWLANCYTDDSHWFEKLYLMFGISRKNVFQRFYKAYDTLLSKKGMLITEEKDLKNEDEDSINQKERDNQNQEVYSDKVPWQTQEVILKLMEYVLKEDPKNAVLAQNVSKLINIACQASSMSIISIKNLGLNILSNILKQFSEIRDSQNPDKSILEQQEASITSSLMSAFSNGDSPRTIAVAINVAAEFIASDIVPLAHLTRISKLFVTLLSNFNDKGSVLKIEDCVIKTQKAKKKIELSALNAWAGIVKHAIISDNKELLNFINSYSDFLIPLWIISLREYVMIKYGRNMIIQSDEDNSIEGLIESKKTKVELYEPIWLNFVEVLGLLMEKDQGLILNSLNENEIDSFMFVLLTQCIEKITSNFDNHAIKGHILPVIHNILRSNVPFGILFEDSIYIEVIGILDRLILTGSTEEKIAIVDILNALIHAYTIRNTSEDEFLQGIDKLYELLRLLLNIVSDLVPFIKFNNFEGNSSNSDILSKQEIILLKKAFHVLELNISQFDDIFKLDLYTCLLFIIGRIFESEEHDILVPTVLPLLKFISMDIIMNGLNIELLHIFYGSVKPIIFNQLSKQNTIATILMLTSVGYPGFTEKETDFITNTLLESLKISETSAITAQGLKTVIKNCFSNNASKVLTFKVLKKILNDLDSVELQNESSVIFSLIFELTKAINKDNDAKLVPAIVVCISFAMWYYMISPGNHEEASSVIITIAKLNPEKFKITLASAFNQAQKKLIEKIVEESTSTKNDSSNLKSSVELKTFT
ncbi:hypothetical protein TPHA_0B04080 [Tetrapisispora phaffii CBS 4417]|uniref:LAA1-like C-terminal TPR repeats domain-containing protein n=1 Tax=Tetrapisispora phaffii (strain ATCC 24235 / CBS 4417 / NBRC 1672 / NRRL Y-8282 / UCD 70-5) TaxID=1071381 RepID=G8BPZ8_TETPH|nr:hypothetical protein TPHA_0B04080 [Tetrapisispora phaffii CBS 4417]CCE62079.1 hypothetical protein TPHA_0B04080 [Tetrapisispora phaffii CBS 4417]